MIIRNFFLTAAIVQSSFAAACIVKDGELTPETGWRLDAKSQGLYLPTTGQLSWVGGDADFKASENYVMMIIPAGCIYQGVGQQGWRVDSKSGALVFAQSLMAKSPAGGAADTHGSAEYVMYSAGTGEPFVGTNSQGKWYFDRNTSGLFFGAGAPAFSTPSNVANFSKSGEYLLQIGE